MNQILVNLIMSGKNAHVSVPLAIGVLLGVAVIWVPDKYQSKVNATGKVLMAYGVMAAAQSGPSQNGKTKGDENETKTT